MGRKQKKSSGRGKAGGGTARPAAQPASPQQAWEQAIAAYEGNEPRRARNLLAPLLDLTSVPGEVVLLAGLVEVQLGDGATGEAYLRRAVQLVPQRLEGLMGLASAQYLQGRFDAAEETYQRVLARSPDNPTALYNLAMAYVEHGRQRDALEALDRLLTTRPDWPGAERNRAIVLVRLRWAEQARAAYEQLLAQTPDDPGLRLEFAEFLEQNNQVDQAATWLPAVAEFDGDRVSEARAEGMHARLLARDGQEDAALAALRAARERTGQDVLGFREGGLLDRLGRTDEAMGAFRRANAAHAGAAVVQRLRSRGYVDYVTEKVGRGIAPQDPDIVDHTADNTDRRRAPVFLVGLPRSGTTLLDRMLGAHPEVQVLEEFDSLRVAESALAAGRTPAQARAAYWDYVERHIDLADNALLVDKNPLHAPHLDNLPQVFPEARVILALRHPYDAALSCYMQDFAPNPASVHFLELESTADLCARLLEMMRLFEQACPQQTVRVRYEDLVGDFESEITRALHGIGLDWHADVADYATRAEATGMVSTPSYEQVTRGLYKTAIERWRRYEQWLGPFREHLGPQLAYFGYDDETAA